MAGQRKSPALGGASVILWTGIYRSKYSTQKQKRQALERTEDAYIQCKRRALKEPTPENLLMELVMRKAFQTIWGRA